MAFARSAIFADDFYQRDLRPINGAFMGRGRNYLPLLACPVDGTPLHQQDGALRCAARPAHVYPFEGGVLRLAPAEDRAALDADSSAYDAAQDAAGRIAPDEAQFKSLPQTALPGYPEDHWPQQAAATALLWRFLEAVRLQNGGPPVGPNGEAAVVGAGLGWLAYGLDVAGYATLALDWRAGPRHGLGAYPIARYLRVQAHPLRLPLAPGAFDWVVFQQPLSEFGDDAAQQALFEAALRALRPGGWVAVMDSLDPTADDAHELHTLFEEAGLALMAAPQQRGWRQRLLELRDRLAGRPPNVPPVMVAQKPRRSPA